MTKLLPLQRRQRRQTKEREGDLHEIKGELFCLSALFHFIPDERCKIVQPHRSGDNTLLVWQQPLRRSERSTLDGLHIPLRLISPASPTHVVSFSPTSFMVTSWSAGAARPVSQTSQCVQ